jgi:hypothetical protein
MPQSMYSDGKFGGRMWEKPAAEKEEDATQAPDGSSTRMEVMAPNGELNRRGGGGKGYCTFCWRLRA